MVFQWCFGGVGFYSPKKYRKGLKEKLAAAVAQLIVNTEANNKNRVHMMFMPNRNWC
jgi:hypothetical protein